MIRTWRWKRSILAALLVLAVILTAGCAQETGETVVATVTVPEAAETTAATEAAVVVSEYTRIENAGQAEIRDVREAALMLEGKPLLVVSEPEQVKALEELFAAAEPLGYEPQTCLLGIHLVLIREDGMAVELELGLLEDLCRLNGEIYDYGPGMVGEDSINGMETLYELLGLTEWTLESLFKWPVEVAQRYDYLLNGYLKEPKPVNPEFRVGNFLAGRDTMVVRMPDGKEIPIEGDAYLPILKPLMFTQMTRAMVHEEEPEVLYEIVITYKIGNAIRTVSYLGNDQFRIRIEGTDFPRYKECASAELAEAAEKWTGIR